MKRIILQGKTEFVATCNHCGCQFSYELEDITSEGIVICPCCGAVIYHQMFNTGLTYQTPFTPPTEIPVNVKLYEERRKALSGGNK